LTFGIFRPVQRVHIEVRGDSIELPIGEIVVGRAGSCGLQLDDPSVSRRHLRIVRRSAGLFVEDLGSSNGTLLNGIVVDIPLAIHDGDTLRVGNRMLVVRMTPECGDELDEESTMQLAALAAELPVDETHARPARRRHTRQPIELQVVYASTALEIEATTHDLSESGVFVRSPVLDPVDTECTLTIHIIGGPTLELRGVVRRVVDREEHGGAPGLGVEFIALGSNEQSWIRAQLDSLRPPPKGRARA
jgi:hypothetical protein